MPTSDPWDGTTWDITAPDNLQVAGNIFKEAYDLRKGVAIRCNKEHTTFAASSAGGVHKNGAAVCYEGTSTPTNRPDGTTALADNAYDRGRLWIDDNYDPPVLKRWTGSAFEVLGRVLVDAASLKLYLINEVAENIDGGRESQIIFKGKKGDSTLHELAMIQASHDGTGDDYKGDLILYVNDGDDEDGSLTEVGRIDSAKLVTLAGGLTIAGALTGGASSNITINTDKFTVNASNGNTVVAGTLSVTGVATVGDGSANATSAAPTADAQLANKKYVDDQVDTQNMTPATYAGEESVTYANGLIVKSGLANFVGSTATVTFGTAFPTAVVSATATPKYVSSISSAVAINTLNTTTLTILQSGTPYNQVYWEVRGY